MERAELGDDGPYECQVGGSESSQPISSNLAWLDVLSKQNHPDANMYVCACECVSVLVNVRSCSYVCLVRRVCVS